MFQPWKETSMKRSKLSHSITLNESLHLNNNINNLAKDADHEKERKKIRKIPFPFGCCRICFDKATGVHYGVPTCEGCKGFFKRSILRKEKYRCYFGDGCTINIENRNRCKSCRFHKCLIEGMSVESVKMGRIPKIVKEKAIKEQHQQQRQQQYSLNENPSSPESEKNVENNDPDQSKDSNLFYTSYLLPNATNPFDIPPTSDILPSFLHSPIPLEPLSFSSDMNSLIHSSLTTTHESLPLIVYEQCQHAVSNVQLLADTATDSYHFESAFQSSNTYANLSVTTSSHATSQTFLSDDFSIDETNNAEMSRGMNIAQQIVKLNTLALTNYMTNCDEHFSINVLERMNTIAPKLSKPEIFTELNYEESTFIRYLRWKMFDLCASYNARTKQLIERMIGLINLGIREYPGNSSSIMEIWAGLTDAIPFHVKNLIAFAKEMPGVAELCSQDFHKMMNNRLFDFWLIKHAPLIRNNESYMMLPNGLQYTRGWMIQIIGEEMVKTMFEFAEKFNQLKLTQEEHALVFPVVICTNDKTLEDQNTVQIIQCCYLYALFVQMCTTRTDYESKVLFHNLLAVFDFLPLLNELQEKKIGPLIPAHENPPQ